MRCKNIDITYSIPVPINEPDGNGNMYTEEAIIKACEKSEGQPIIQYNSEGKEVPIGIARTVKYSNGFIWVEGTIWYGGTSESVLFDQQKQITDIKIVSFGLCE